MSNTSQSTRPEGRVLWEELLEGEGEKSEGETSIFLVLTVVSIWDAVLKLTHFSSDI